MEDVCGLGPERNKELIPHLAVLEALTRHPLAFPNHIHAAGFLHKDAKVNVDIRRALERRGRSTNR